MTVFSKFDELQAKTERELIQLINHELDRGIREARQALSAESWAFGESHYLRAQRAYAEASRLLPLVEAVANDQLEHLREMLEGLAVLRSTPLSSTPKLTDETIAPVARALWKARGCPEGSPEDDWHRAEQALKSQKQLHAACC
ncbi:MAG TPA: DUF2934 domain-containing protein [Bryobacteraceae bacterium]|nr:DUF2934 domain-containing protein [Bryobacteraceae bacterium]